MARALTVRPLPIALVAAAGMGASALGQTQWKAAANGNWKDDANWNPATQPNNANTPVLIGVAGPYTVTLDDGNKIIKAMQLSGASAALDVTGRTLTVDTGGFTLIGDGVLHLASGTIKRGSAGGFNMGSSILRSEGVSAITGFDVTKSDGIMLVTSFSNLSSTLTIDQRLFQAKGSVTVQGDKLNQAQKADVTLAVKTLFQNDNGAKFQLRKGTGDGGQRIFSGNLLNKGTVNVGLNGDGAEGVFLGTANNQSYINDNQFVIDTTGNASTLLVDGNDFKPTFNQRNGKLTTGGAFTGRKLKFQYDGGEIDGPVFLERSDLGMNGTANAIKPAVFFITGGAKGNNDTLNDTFSEMTTDIPKDQTVVVRGFTDMPWTGLRKQGNTQTLINKGTVVMDAGSTVVKADDVRVALGKDDAVFQNEATFSILSGAATKADGGKRLIYGTLINKGNTDIHTDVDFQTPNIKKHENSKGGTIGMIGPKKKGDPEFVTVTMPVTSVFTNNGFGDPKSASFRGNGKLKVSKVINSGTLKPGKIGPASLPDTGQIMFEGDDGDPLGCSYTQQDGGNIETTIGGYTHVDEYDMVRVDGAATFEPGAFADLTLSPGFYPVLGDRFDIFTATQGIAGSMVLHSNPGWNGLTFELQTNQTYDFESGLPVWAVQAVVVPAPGMSAVMVAGGLVACARRRRDRLG